MSDVDDFMAKKKWLEEYGEEYSPLDFYRFVFPEGSFERLNHQEDRKGNGIALTIGVDEKGTPQGKRTLITDGLEQIPELINNDFVVMSPISYFGRSNKADHALWLHALTIDVDYVSVKNLLGMESLMYPPEVMPIPTFVVNSGHGVHLYYVFEEPIPMYKPVQRALKQLKTDLMHWCWNKKTSMRPDRVETLGIVQGFRMVGSPTKMGKKHRITAYKVGERVTLDYLNNFAREPEHRVEETTYKTTCSLEEAKEKYPEWYEQRIVKKKAGRWHNKRDLYDWFKLKASLEGRVQHRYFCVMCLAIYAVKCDIPYDELLKDARDLQETLDNPKEPFLWEEAVKALEAYNDNVVTWPRQSIAEMSGLDIKPNKRNGRKQELHLKRARRIKAGMIEDGEPFKNPEGRPSKQQQVAEWRKAHPEGKKIECERETGLSRHTILKWWDTKTAD